MASTVTATSLPNVRPLPTPATLKVAGTSFRQQAVAAAYAGEELTVEWVPHPKDRYACEVRGHDHRHLGFIPANLNERVISAGRGLPLRATVDKVVGVETLGLRIVIHGPAD